MGDRSHRIGQMGPPFSSQKREVDLPTERPFFFKTIDLHQTPRYSLSENGQIENIQFHNRQSTFDYAETCHSCFL